MKTSPVKRKTIKKANYSRKKKLFLQRRFWMFFVLFWIFLLCFLYKDRLVYCYKSYFNKIEHKVLKNNAFETKRINRIIDENIGNIFGFDISHYQRKEEINWDSLTIGSGSVSLDFVILRATMGNKKKDKHFEHFWKEAKKHDIIRGAYHFYRPDEDPTLQAKSFLSAVTFEKGDLRPVLDVEKMPKRKSKEQYISDIKIWLKLVEESCGKKPIVYTYYYFYKDYLRGELDDYPLWLANYNDVKEPSGNDEWEMWQFTENGIVNGINVKVDLNIFRGNKRDLKKLTLD